MLDNSPYERPSSGGAGRALIGFRPKPSALFLERPRLLNMLPEETGYIVWLEAPYGYGKSVLVSQWVAQLERDDWRVIWLALVDGDPRPALASALGLADGAWSAMLEELSKRKTLVIFEDLENNPDAMTLLGTLLKHNPGLIVLSSRNALHSPELLRSRSEGRLIHLRAEHLAFTAAEAATLFGDGDSSRAYEQTRGWSLPLHMAALTGELPAPESLWEGVRQSLEPPIWGEVLLLSALPYLPTGLADGRCQELTRLGFVQALESGYRLHPLAAETVFKRHGDAVRAAVLGNLERLPLALRAEAFARSGLLDDLEALLEGYGLAVEDSVGVLRWDALCQRAHPTAPSPARLLTLSWAYSVTNQHDLAMQTYLAAAQHADASPDERLNAYGWALFDLKPHEFHQAERLLEEARPWLEQVSPTVRGSFLVNAATFYMEMQRWQDAEPLLIEALPIVSPENRRAGEINLALVRWELRGELRGYLEQLEQSTDLASSKPFNVCMALETLGKFYALLGQPARALEQFDRLEELREHSPDVALLGRVQATALRVMVLEWLPDRFAALERDASPAQIGFVRAHWARCLRLAGLVAQAHALLEGLPRTALVWTEQALALRELGQSVAALECLTPALESSLRLELMRASAAQFRITRDPADFERLLKMSDVGAEVLPSLVPLSDLPKDRVDLASAYPLRDVLHSGWRAAVKERQAEIPPLEIRVLGGFAVHLLGQPLSLTGRSRDILILLALGLSRDAIADALWPEADFEKSRNNLHVNLNLLRKRLEPWVIPTYLLEGGLTRCHVDLSDLEAALTRRDIPNLRALYADLAPDVHLLPVTEARDHWRERTLQVALEYVRQHSDDETTLEWLLRLDPLHEEALSLLLAHLMRSGRRVSARRRFADYSRRLRATFGLEPAPDTERILAG